MTCSFAVGFSIKIWMVSPRIMSVQYIGGCSVHWRCSVRWRVNMSTSGALWFILESKLIKAFDLYWNLNVQCTAPDVLMISSHLHHGNPLVFWTYPNVLMVSRLCTKHSPPSPVYRTHIIYYGSTAPRVTCRSSKKEDGHPGKHYASPDWIRLIVVYLDKTFQQIIHTSFKQTVHFSILKVNACCLTLTISYLILLFQPLFVPCLFEKVHWEVKR